MRKIINLTLIASFLTIASCKKNNVAIDKDAVTTTSFARFLTATQADSVGTYYIKSSNDSYKLPIGVTTVSDKDRVVNFTYSSNTATGSQYNAPASIVIPAGKAVDTLRVNGLFAGYPLATRIDTVKITIEDAADIRASEYITPRKDVYRLLLRKYCDVLLPSFAGNYTSAIDNGNYGPYPMSIVPASLVSTGTTTGTMTIKNLWDYGVPSITTNVVMDWTNPASFTLTIPDQVYYAADGLWIKGTTAGSFSSCDQKFTFRYTLYYKTTGLNYSANQVTVMAR
jgi:hypothetical protein